MWTSISPCSGADGMGINGAELKTGGQVFPRLTLMSEVVNL